MLVFALAVAGPPGRVADEGRARRLVVDEQRAGVDNDLTINYDGAVRGLRLPGSSCDPSYRFTDTAETVTVVGLECIAEPAAPDAGTRIVRGRPAHAGRRR